jgi:uncharacterized protein (DUF305 family)
MKIAFVLSTIGFTVLLVGCSAAAPSNQGMQHSMSSAMTMDDMTKALSGKTGDAFDQAFIQMMIPHHQGAIEMAKAAQASAKHDEIKKMAADIIAAQQREIDMMQGWQKAWGYTK